MILRLIAVFILALSPFTTFAQEAFRISMTAPIIYKDSLGFRTWEYFAIDEVGRRAYAIPYLYFEDVERDADTSYWEEKRFEVFLFHPDSIRGIFYGTLSTDTVEVDSILLKYSFSYPTIEPWLQGKVVRRDSSGGHLAVKYERLEQLEGVYATLFADYRRDMNMGGFPKSFCAQIDTIPDMKLYQLRLLLDGGPYAKYPSEIVYRMEKVEMPAEVRKYLR